MSLDVVSDHGLYTIRGSKQCLGHLFAFEDKVFDPSHGQVPVPRSEVDKHNELLDRMLVEGLDKSCEVGQGYFFYCTKDESGRWQVTSWTGVVVAPPADTQVAGKVVTFNRNGKTFRGRRQKHADSFNFTRVQ